MRKFGKPAAFIGLFALTFLLAEKPACANSPLFWGIYGSGATVYLSLATGGIALVLVTIIEALVFMRFFKIAFLKSLGLTFVLNLVSAVIGMIFGAMGFGGSASFAIMVFFIPGCIILGYLTWKARVPGWMRIIALITIIIGFLGAVRNMNFQPPNPPWAVYLALATPLLIGFGLTILIESLMVKKLFVFEKPWTALLVANICSYILLFLLVPFFPNNPYQDPYAMSAHNLGNAVYSGEMSSDELLEYLYHRRASNLWLLGYRPSDPPPREVYRSSLGSAFSANRDELFELLFLYTAVQRYAAMRKPPDALTDVVDDTLRFDNITTEQREKLLWFKTLFEFQTGVIDAVENDDIEAFSSLYAQWVRWAHDVPAPPIDLGYSQYELSVDPDTLLMEPFVEMIKNRDDNEKFLRFLRARTNAQFTLRTENPGDSYDASFENGLLAATMVDVSVDPNIGLEIINVSPGQFNVEPTGLHKLEWFVAFLNLWIPLREAVRVGDEVEIESSGQFLRDRFLTHPYPGDEFFWRNLDVDDLISEAREYFHGGEVENINPNYN